MKKNFKTFHVQRNKWKKYNKNVICQAFYCIHDKNEIDVKVFQIIRCIICCNSPTLEFNIKTQARKGFNFRQHNKWNKCFRKKCFQFI